MLRVLLAKDLRRARRNPLPWLINLIVPLVMTALIGLVFGGHSDGGALGRIRFAVVDEDQSVLSHFLRGAADQREGSQYLEPVFMGREAALRTVNAGKISAVLIIPTNFMHHYLMASAPVTLELVKNPAEAIHPAVLEELFGAVVTALNEVSRNFNSEFPAWQAMLDGPADFDQVQSLLARAGAKIKSAKQFIYPPLIGYTKPASGSGTNGGTGESTSRAIGDKAAAAQSTDSVFAYLLIGLSAMFLLFIAGNAMADLLRELKLRTFERYQTMQQRLWPFIVSKIAYAVAVLLLGSAVMLGGGGLIFGFHWAHPWLLMPLTLGYATFVAALFAVLVALVPDERRAGVLNNIASMALGLAGGCAFPPQQLPAFVRDHITPLLPSAWFADTLRNLECGSGSAPWLLVTLKLATTALVLVGLAAFLFQRRFKSGARA